MSAVKLYFCCFIIKMFCLLVVKGENGGHDIPLVSEYPCMNSKFIIVGTESNLRTKNKNTIYININKNFTANSVLKISFDISTNVTYVGDRNEWRNIYLRGGKIMVKRFLTLQTGFSCIVKGTREHPLILSLEIDDVQYCGGPMWVQEKEVLSKDSCQNKSTDQKHDKPNFHCGRRIQNSSWVTDPISGMLLPQDTGSVVDGVASPGEWPWYVAVHKFNKSINELKFVCEGTLISHRFVLTSALCVMKDKDSHNIGYEVEFSKYKIAWGQSPVMVKVEKTLISGGYSDILSEQVDPQKLNYFNGHIALLKLKSEVKFSNFIRPACLWHRKETNLNDRSEAGVLASFELNNNSPISSTLEHVNLTMVPKDTCNVRKEDDLLNWLLYGKNFCTEYPSRPDWLPYSKYGSGFHVFIPDYNITHEGKIASGSWYLRGISTFVLQNEKSKTDKNIYMIFIAVEQYADWIDSQLEA